MSKKIIGVTVGTTISPKKIEKELKPVKTVNGQAPDENGNVAVVGNNGADGKDGVSPVISVSDITGGHRLTITDKSGTKTVDVMDGADGKNGTNGSAGKDGVSATHSWNGTILNVTSASGTSSADLKGEKGDKGDTGDIPATFYPFLSKPETIFPETLVVLDTPHGANSYRANMDTPINIIAGNTYTILWGEATYKCVAKKFSNATGAYLGNGWLLEEEQTEDPFCIEAFPFGSEPRSRVTSFDGKASVRLAIYSESEQRYGINPKYIPGMYYTEEVQDGVIVPPTTAISSEFAMMGELYVMGPPITLVAGKTYRVNYNGVNYECVATAAELQGESIIAMGDLAVLVTGIPSGAYPFVMATGEFVKILGASIAVIPLDGNIPTVAIYGEKTEIHKMPAKFLPEEVYSENIPSYTHERILFSGKSTIDYSDNTDLVNFILENGNSNKISIRCGDLDGSGVSDGIYVFEKIPFNYGYAYMSRGFGSLRVCFICLQLYNYGGYFDLTGFYRAI